MPPLPEPPLILLLDGDGLRRGRLREALEKRGYAVATYDRVAPAIAEARRQRPRAILAAERLPDGTAHDLLGEVRGCPRPFALVHGDWPSDALPHRPPRIDVLLGHPLDELRAVALVTGTVPIEPADDGPALRHGDHMVLAYTSAAELDDALAAACGRGLAGGNRSIIACPDRPFADAARAQFERAGIEVEREERAGSLCFVDQSECYLLGGRFDPQAMRAFLQDLTLNALRDGFCGLFAAGEARWIPSTPEDWQAWMVYERSVAELTATMPLTTLCLYPTDHFDPALLLDVLRNHPLVLAGRVVCENSFYHEAAGIAEGDPVLALGTRLAAVRELPRLG